MADLPLPEFSIPAQDPERSHMIALAFSKLQQTIDGVLPPSRERGLVLTKLQEAHFFAQIAPRIP
jgi:hypothetical protein